MKKNALKKFLQTRVGFLTLLVLLFWIKYLFVAYFNLDLGLTDPYQHIIMWITPIPTSILIIGIGFYFPRPKASYIMMLIMDGINTALLFANVLYYRQFSDFLTVKTIINSGKVSQGLGKSAVSLLQPTDILMWLDIIVVIILLFWGKIKIDQRSYGLSTPFAITSFGMFLLGLNVFLAETSRPKLLRNTFDRTYVVKYLGLDTYTAYDAAKSAQTVHETQTASSQDLNKILNYTSKKHLPASPQYYGVEKGKNVIVLHLESFQQFLINLKINGKEVTPFLNSLYSNKHSISFDNFYHQVGLGRTSDAENMLETSTYGIPDGSLFSSLGSNNTFQAAPQILKQDGYTSAVFHGNVASFWNRNAVYKNMGYNYFFDANYFSDARTDKIGYGIKDKLLFAESIKYLERMQQPFYCKYLTVTNHIPFSMDAEDLDPNFKTSNTNDATINNYFQTAHYLDQALREFFDYLKRSGLEKNTLVMIYGDHYGLTNSENQTLAPLIGQNADTWNDFNDVQMQRVPFILYSPNLKGFTDHKIAGEIDVLPTLLHLLGIDNKNYVEFGSDLFSPKYKDWVVFRNGTIVSQRYVIIGGKGIKGTVFDRKSGKQILHFTKREKFEIKSLTKEAKKELKLSDLLNNNNLLRLYTPIGFTPVDPNQYDYLTNYSKMLAIEKELGSKSTALYDLNHGSTTRLYRTDSQQLENRRNEITQVPKTVQQDNLPEKKSKNNQN